MKDRHIYIYTEIYKSLSFNVIIHEDAKVYPFADVRAEVENYPLLFLRPAVLVRPEIQPELPWYLTNLADQVAVNEFL